MLNADTSWTWKEILYTSAMAPLMVAALVEWACFAGVFLYCFLQVFLKGENMATKILAVVCSFVFAILRLIYLAVMFVTLPLPDMITQYFPHLYVVILQWFAFATFSALLTVSWLCNVYLHMLIQLGRDKSTKMSTRLVPEAPQEHDVEASQEHDAAKVMVVMPCFNEQADVLFTAVNSVIDNHYPSSCLHVFLSFDGDAETDLYLGILEKLNVPMSLSPYPKSIDLSYRSVRITVSRFPHGGKRKCQKATWKLINKIYSAYLAINDDIFILFIDSDCILDRNCIRRFIYEMQKGGSKKLLAMTGVITSTTKKTTWLTLLQDMEYIHGQLLERTFESLCGSVTCLPGALTMLRFSAFQKMAKYYFADSAEECEDLFDYQKCHLGEDRWLTHLFMVGANERYQIQICTTAFCKTEAVQTFQALLKQRRRWFLGFITNEVCMLTDVRIWRKYPLLNTMRAAQDTIRTTSLLFFVLVLALATGSKKAADLPLGFMGISLGLNWAMMIWFGYKLNRYKAWLYPIMFVVMPFMNFFFNYHAVRTYSQRTWGGPRTDAAVADEHTTPQQAIEQAEATGDDLNIIPETFRPAAEAHRRTILPSLPLQPPDSVQGRFAVPDKLPGGWYRGESDSLDSIGNPSRSQAHIPLNPRSSFDSIVSSQTGGNSIYFPRRVESLIDEEDARRSTLAQVDQIIFQEQRQNEDTSENSLTFQSGRPHSQRATSYGSMASLTDGTTDSASGPFVDRARLRVTPDLISPQGQISRQLRIGGSPLGRASLLSSGVDMIDVELQDQSHAISGTQSVDTLLQTNSAARNSQRQHKPRKHLDK